jgi:hypothetical protein
MLLCNFFSFLLVFKIIKGCHQDFSLLCTIILVIHHLLEQNRFTLNVFSPKKRDPKGTPKTLMPPTKVLKLNGGKNPKANPKKDQIAHL